MKLSDHIEKFIKDILDDSDGIAELSRVALSDMFNCVPSQINYVISTRFSPEHGFVVESRRGGGGYIRISQVRLDRNTLIMHVINSIGNTIDLGSANAFLSNMVLSGAVEKQQARIISSALSDNSLRAISPIQRDNVRACIFKQCLLSTL